MKLLPITAFATVLATPALAQVPISPVPLYYVPSVPARIEAMPRNLPRAKGPDLKTALQLAQAAVADCTAKGEKVSAQVADSAGVMIVLLSGDGAGERSQLITSVKVAFVAKYWNYPGDVSQLAKTDKKLAQEIKENPNLGSPRGSGVALMRGKEFFGVLAVSGAPGIDETCAKAALVKYPFK